MKKSGKARSIIYFCTFILPILLASNCDGWNAAEMSVDSCVIENQFFVEAANFIISMVFISSFMGFIPILIYIFVVILSVEMSILLMRIISGKPLIKT